MASRESWSLFLQLVHTFAGASVLYSEDLQHGQTYDEVQVQNPFQHELA
jgi:predicted nucleic acid-binding protein